MGCLRTRLLRDSSTEVYASNTAQRGPTRVFQALGGRTCSDRASPPSSTGFAGAKVVAKAPRVAAARSTVVVSA